MSSSWDHQQMAAPGAASHAMNTVQPTAQPTTEPVVDAGGFTPEQWQAYQQSYQQAIQAQQMYAQAQQWYEYATQTGQTEQQQQAYYQATQAQELYNYAHQTYLAILNQVQAAAHVANASPPSVSQAVDPSQAYGQAYGQGQLYHTPQPGYPQGYGAVETLPPPQPMPQQSSSPPQYMPQQVSSPPQYMPQGYAQGYAQSYTQGYGVEQGGYDVSQGYPPGYGSSEYAQGYGGYPPSQPGQSGGFADPLAEAPEAGSASHMEGWVSLEEDESVRRGSIWFWIVGLLLLGGGFGVLSFLDTAPSRKPINNTATQKAEPSAEELEKQRRALLGEDQERPSEHLRKLSLTRTGEWRTLALAGTGDCRSLYLTDDQGAYVAEGIVPKSDPDYLQQTHPDQPFNPQPLSVPKSPAFRSFSGSLAGTFLLFRTRVASQSWLLIYPLVGNPLKPPKEVKPPKTAKKADDDGPSCGDSRVSSHVLRRNLVMLGDGSCNPAAETLGVEPKLCIPNVSLSNVSLLHFWHTGRDITQMQGALQMDQKQLVLTRRGQVKESSRLGIYLRESTPPTPDHKKHRWVSVRRTNGQVWTLDQRLTLKEMPLRLSEGAGVAVRARLHDDTLWVIYPQRIVKFQVDNNQLQNPKTYELGKNITVKYANWSQDGQLLIVLTEKNTLYQFSEDP